MSISYQVEHERRKDDAVKSCINIFDNFSVDEVLKLSRFVQEAWSVGERLVLANEEMNNETT